MSCPVPKTSDGNWPVRIIVTRSGQHWFAELPDLDLTYKVRTLYQLDHWVRFTFGSGWIEYRFHTGDARLDQLITDARQARREARSADEKARHLTRRALVAAENARLSGRDLAVLLAISHQRIQQLRREPPA
jgi:hypothetical protein